MSRELRSKRTLGLLAVLLAFGLVATGVQAQADHLLLTKVVVKTRPVPTYGSEYVAITNPTAASIDLSTYYLTDATFSGAPYWELAQGDGAGGGGTNGDFNARFPDGASLAAGETIVIAVEGSSVFQTQFGILPDFELFEDGTAPDDVPDLVEAHPGSIGTGLGNAGSNTPPSDGWLDNEETLVLYTWDGSSDLVQDVDYLTWGGTTTRADKTGLDVDGPDADSTPTAYLADTVVGSQSPMTVSTFLEANDRLDDAEGTETLTGGNGLGGHDETSENLAVTWGITGTMTPPVSGTARFAAPVITAAALAGASQTEDVDVAIDITLISPPSNAADEMVLRYRVDGGSWSTVGAYPESGNDWSATIPGQLRDVVVDWWVTVTGEEPGTDTWPSAAPFYFESYTVLPPVDPGDGPAHLLFTEVCVTYSENEFVEIYNPTDEDVSLDNYYLTDAVHDDQGYWLISAGVLDSDTIGGGTYNDFQAHFPSGYVIPAGETITVSLFGSDGFSTAWGIDPDFELIEDGTSDAIPDMLEVFPGSNQAGPPYDTAAGLTNSSETIVLYYWDGVTDLVTDIDMFFWGSTESAFVDKTGVTVGSSTYAADTAIGIQDPFPSSHDGGSSFHRLIVEETGEIDSGGNGALGHDETSEPLSTTWVIGTGSPGVFGAVSLAINNAVLTPSRPQPDESANAVVTVLGSVTVTGVTLHYTVDGGLFNAVTCIDAGGGEWTGTIPGLPDGSVVTWYVSADGDGGESAVWPTGAPGNTMGYTVELYVPGDGPPHLLLTEVCVTYSDNEFVEIYNPTDEVVSLDNFYLTDAIHSSQGYWLISGGNLSSETIGGGTYNDFQARFPSGHSIQPGEVITVSLFGSDAYSTAWGIDPDFELIEDGAADAIPDMLEVFPGSNQAGPPYDTPAGLTNSSETIVLYYWDGVTDLVTDIDMFFWGSTESAFVDKTGVTVGGSTYAADTAINQQQPFPLAHDGGSSYQRLAPDEAGESLTGGNGPDGHDETSEPLPNNWTVEIGSPGVYDLIDLAITGATLSPSSPQPTEDATVTSAVAGLVDVASVTLHYAVDGGAYQDVTCDDNGNGTWSGVIPGQAENAVVAWYVTVAGSGGESVVWPEGAPGTVENYTVEIIVAGEGLARLLLTEIATLGSTAEFIEIYNPNTFDVDLKNYYLTDAIHYDDQAYWNLPAGSPTQSTIGGGAFADFNARFPDDAVLPAGESITISMAGSSAFGEVFVGELPHYEMFEDNDYADGVTDMEEVFPGSINGDTAPTLTNFGDTGTYINGEIVALYYWDGISDLVVDIDIFIWGEGLSYSATKQGVTIGSSTYASEANYPDPFMTEHAHLESYQRVDFDEGTEAQAGSNGFEGADETSENFTATWTVGDADPASVEIPVGEAAVTLAVPARTFLPNIGERFLIEFTTEPKTESVLRIFDLEGRLVRTLFDSRFDGAASTVADFPSIEAWDGRNDVYELVKAGMYIIHLQVTDKESGDRTEKTAPAVVATRLSN